MKPFLKWFSIVAIIIVAGAITAMLYFHWRKNNQYAELMELKAFYMQYACGSDDLEMKVQSVDHTKFRFMLEKDIALVTKDKKNERLYSFIEKVMATYNSGKEEVLRDFIITGYLHKYPHSYPFDCSGSPWFTVEKIAYADGKSISF